ncbi:hypothetical protein BC831DRAFT_95686 [Entophlyctis helioformis]|nr:hypothetical protein BC831DRAFT_95686 [Entophlyctis helioformis]
MWPNPVCYRLQKDNSRLSITTTRSLTNITYTLCSDGLCTKDCVTKTLQLPSQSCTPSSDGASSLGGDYLRSTTFTPEDNPEAAAAAKKEDYVNNPYIAFYVILGLVGVAGIFFIFFTPDKGCFFRARFCDFYLCSLPADPPAFETIVGPTTPATDAQVQASQARAAHELIVMDGVRMQPLPSYAAADEALPSYETVGNAVIAEPPAARAPPSTATPSGH